MSRHSISAAWRSHGLQPHRMRQFKLSNDPRFADKVRDIVGLYVDPPAHAVVLSIDEGSQIQALDRTQPGLPLKRGRFLDAVEARVPAGKLVQAIVGNYAAHKHPKVIQWLGRHPR